MSSQKTIRVAELFAGVGGFRLGLEGYHNPDEPQMSLPAAGPYKTIWANQWEPPGTDSKQFAARCYRARFGEDSVVNEDDIVPRLNTTCIYGMLREVLHRLPR